MPTDGWVKCGNCKRGPHGKKDCSAWRDAQSQMVGCHEGAAIGEPEKKTVGCSVCYSRGKRGGKPCAACGGTGRIAVGPTKGAGR